MRRFLALVVAVLSCVVCNTSKADLIVSIGNVSIVEGGGTVLVPVTVRSTMPATDSLKGFNFPLSFTRPLDLIDPIDGPGTSGDLPTGLTFNASPIANGAGFGSTSGPADPTLGALEVFQDYDFIVNDAADDTNPTLTFGTTNPQTLFSLRMNIGDAASAPAGTVFNIDFVRPGFANAFNMSDANDQTITTFTLSNGSITVTAVPEPGSMALIGLASLSCVGFRRRRR